MYYFVASQGVLLRARSHALVPERHTQLTLEHCYLQVDISKCDNTSNYVCLRVQPCELADIQIEYNLTVIYNIP